MDVSRALIRQVLKDKETLDRVPELGWYEKHTSAYIKRALQGTPVFSQQDALIYEVGTGVPVFFRAELDALGTPSGVKHVCGHSAHMAALMGAYRYFREHPVAGVRMIFVFQPCEEGYPSGAKYISDQYARVRNSAFGVAFHTFPGTSAGELIVPTMAGGDYIEITLKSTSTHIKNKYERDGTDCVSAASALALELNRFLHTEALLNIGVLTAGNTPNSIAGEAILKGDVRWLSKTGQRMAQKHFTRALQRVKRQYSQINIHGTYHIGYPLLLNDPILLKRVAQILPIAKTHTTFATEDFSLYPVRKLFLLVATGQMHELHEERFVVPQAVVVMLLKYWILIGTHLRGLVVNEKKVVRGA